MTTSADLVEADVCLLQMHINVSLNGKRFIIVELNVYIDSTDQGMVSL